MFPLFTISFTLNDNTITKGFKLPDNKSGWYSFEIKPGKHHITLEVKDKWSGKIEAWLSGYESQDYQTIKIKTTYVFRIPNAA